MRCLLQTGCERERGHEAKTPCGKDHIPGSPCDYCGKPTPMTGDPCPDCWVSLTDKPMADTKALMAQAGLSLNVRDQGEGER